MTRAARYLKILEGRVSPESEGPQMFPSLHPLSTALLLGALPPQNWAGRDLGSRGHSPHTSASSAVERWEMQCVVVRPSPLFLAAIQIMNGPQTRSHPVFLPPWPWERLWGGRQRVGNATGRKALNQPLPLLPQLPSEPRGVLSSHL